MSVADPTNVEKNADDLIAQGLAGKGPLAANFKNIYQNADSQAALDYKYAHRNDEGDLVPQSAEDLKKAVNDKVNEGAATMKTALLSAAKGETKFDLKEMVGTASTIQTMFSGGLIGMIAAIPQLLSNSIVGDYVKAIVSYLFDNDKKESFGDKLAEVRMDKGMAKLADDLKIDPNALQAAFKNNNTPEPQASQPQEKDVKITQKGNQVNVTEIGPQNEKISATLIVQGDGKTLKVSGVKVGEYALTPDQIAKLKDIKVDSTDLNTDGTLNPNSPTLQKNILKEGEVLGVLSKPATQGTAPAGASAAK